MWIYLKELVWSPWILWMFWNQSVDSWNCSWVCMWPVTFVVIKTCRNLDDSVCVLLTWRVSRWRTPARVCVRALHTLLIWSLISGDGQKLRQMEQQTGNGCKAHRDKNMLLESAPNASGHLWVCFSERFDLWLRPTPAQSPGLSVFCGCRRPGSCCDSAGSLCLTEIWRTHRAPPPHHRDLQHVWVCDKFGSFWSSSWHLALWDHCYDLLSSVCGLTSSSSLHFHMFNPHLLCKLSHGLFKFGLLKPGLLKPGF